jgi:hypothetical protein
LGIVTGVKPRQFEKADSPMFVTLLGIVIEVISEIWKTCFPIRVTVLGILNESYSPSLTNTHSLSFINMPFTAAFIRFIAQVSLKAIRGEVAIKPSGPPRAK